MHLMLNALNVEQYEENVSLQLLTFAHQYASSILQDAIVYQDHRGANSMEASDVKLAIASRTNRSFKGAPPKEFLLELAGERNKRPLPLVNPGYGLRLPPEKYCLTNVNWAALSTGTVPNQDAGNDHTAGRPEPRGDAMDED
ncbi:Transcription initiation factor TFIID subunit 9 [Savitreella phatthalungensis]